MAWTTARTEYSRAEYLSDAVVHASGLLIALVAAPTLIGVAIVMRGDFTAVAGTSVYALSLVATLLFSALYNTVGQRRWTGLLRRLDHSAIFTMIAGTYTPFTMLSGGQGTWLLTGIWVAALVGVAIKIFAIDRMQWTAIGLCLGMGWSGAVIPGQDFLAATSPTVFMLILTGGAIYTIGVVLYLYDRLPFHYTVWHVCVLTASMLFYAAVTLQLLQSVA